MLFLNFESVLHLDGVRRLVDRQDSAAILAAED